MVILPLKPFRYHFDHSPKQVFPFPMGVSGPVFHKAFNLDSFNQALSFTCGISHSFQSGCFSFPVWWEIFFQLYATLSERQVFSKQPCLDFPFFLPSYGTRVGPSEGAFTRPLSLLKKVEGLNNIPPCSCLEPPLMSWAPGSSLTM